MVVNGLDRMVISVKSMEESLAFYRDKMGMTIVGECDLGEEVLQKLWSLSPEIKGKSIFLQKGDRPVLIQLVEFSPKSKGFIRKPGEPNYDYGIYDIGFRVKNMEKAYKELSETYEFINPPKTYQAPWTDVTVKEVVMITPDQLRNAFMQSGTVPMEEDFGLVTTNAHFVKSVDEANAFYKDVLGFQIVFDKIMPAGLVNSILGIPEACEPRISMAFKPGTKAPVPEFIECGCEGRYIHECANPTDIGMFSVAYEVENLEEVLKKINTSQYSQLCDIIETSIPTVGTIKSVLVEGPAKIKHEIYSRLR